MHDHVRVLERRPERVDVAHVTAPILHLRPAALCRIEGTPGDADHPLDPVVLLEQRHQGQAEGPGGAGDRHGQARFVGHP